jgi:hypothetical protein
MLWQRLLLDRDANTLWQRLRRNLLMLIQLAILALLVFALARPFIPVPSITSGSVVVLLDGSASMLAEEEGVERFALAQGEVGTLINDLAGDSRMTLILVGDTPQVLVSAGQDPSILHQELAKAHAAPAEADWPAALALAAGAAQGFVDGRVVLVTDGGLPDALPPMPVEVIVRTVGSAEENLAISALSSRETPEGSQLFASVTNYGQHLQTALLGLALDDELYDARHIEVRPGDKADFVWSIPEGATVISAEISEITDDHLPSDNMAWAIHEGGRQSRVLLLSEGNRFLETALAVIPGIEVFRVDPSPGLSGVNEGEFDLLILDSVALPADLPRTEMLIINPQRPTEEQRDDTVPVLTTGSVFTNTEVIRVEDSPLLRFVDWGGVNVLTGREVSAPWMRSLVLAEGGPLLLAGDADGRRAVILPFRLQDSDLPLQIAFPIVMANIMGWLDPGGSLLSVADYVPGEPVRIGTDSSAETMVVRRPDGTLWTQAADEAGLVFPDTGQLGLYEILSRSADGQRTVGRFTVNLRSEAESRIAPTANVQAGSDSPEIAQQAAIGQRELWPWLALAALVVLMVEWWIYYRGARWPNHDDWSSLTGGRFG